MSNHKSPQTHFQDQITFRRECENTLLAYVERCNLPLGLLWLDTGQTVLRLAEDEPTYKLLGTCPNCGREAWSLSFTDDAGLDEQTARFAPSRQHLLICQRNTRQILGVARKRGPLVHSAPRAGRT